MITRKTLTTTALFALIAAAPAAARQDEANRGTDGASPPTATDTLRTKAAAVSVYRDVAIQRFRTRDQRGLTVFEAPKNDGVPFDGFRLEFGAAFTQQFQALSHENKAAPNVVDGVDLNRLVDIGPGFNLAAANLYVDAQLAPGIRVALTTYLSSRHHPEAWVKDGYLLIDESPIAHPLLESIMEYVTLRIGHMEVNYGDAHFRRTDNGNALYNPFVGNYVMEAFTTEIGGEVYVRANGWLAMAGVTGGEIKGMVTRPDDRGPSFIGKLGYDRRISPDLRLRLTGSVYTTGKSVNNTLYGGDRAGSRYFYVMENEQATESAQFTSGHVNPGLRSEVTAFMINPFVQVGGLELFGLAEQAKGKAANETKEREWTQYAVDAVYRFFPGDRFYVGGRYNTVSGELSGFPGQDVSVDRIQIGAGWFITPMVLMKAEYVTQKYNDFPVTDIRHGGKFNGLMVEGVIAF